MGSSQLIVGEDHVKSSWKNKTNNLPYRCHDGLFVVWRKGSVPEAIIIAFLDSWDFESAIRLAVSLGGDSDTIAAMSGSIAEAFYGGVPQWIADELIKRLPEIFIKVINRFDIFVKKKFEALWNYFMKIEYSWIFYTCSQREPPYIGSTLSVLHLHQKQGVTHIKKQPPNYFFSQIILCSFVVKRRSLYLLKIYKVNLLFWNQQKQINKQ